jgi:hypothetical protein
LLKNVISYSEVWTVGPLDYCSVARILKAQGGGKDMYAVPLIFHAGLSSSEPSPLPAYLYVRKTHVFQISTSKNGHFLVPPLD